MKPFRQCAFCFAVLVVLANALPAVALAVQVPEKEGVGVAEFTIVGHRFRIPKAYLTQRADIDGRILEDWGDAVFMRV